MFLEDNYRKYQIAEGIKQTAACCLGSTQNHCPPVLLPSFYPPVMNTLGMLPSCLGPTTHLPKQVYIPTTLLIQQATSEKPILAGPATAVFKQLNMTGNM